MNAERSVPADELLMARTRGTSDKDEALQKRHPLGQFDLSSVQTFSNNS